MVSPGPWGKDHYWACSVKLWGTAPRTHVMRVCPLGERCAWEDDCPFHAEATRAYFLSCARTTSPRTLLWGHLSKMPAPPGWQHWSTTNRRKLCSGKRLMVLHFPSEQGWPSSEVGYSSMKDVSRTEMVESFWCFLNSQPNLVLINTPLCAYIYAELELEVFAWGIKADWCMTPPAVSLLFTPITPAILSRVW